MLVLETDLATLEAGWRELVEEWEYMEYLLLLVILHKIIHCDHYLDWSGKKRKENELYLLWMESNYGPKNSNYFPPHQYEQPYLGILLGAPASVGHLNNVVPVIICAQVELPSNDESM